MPAGPIKLNAECTEKGYPFSLRVGTLGNTFSLWSVHTTRRRNVPALTCSFHSVVCDTACTCPPSRAVTACRPPGNGTWFHSIFSLCAMYSIARCCPVPNPEVAYWILLGFFFA